mmetsp:Transcript_18404/g.36657  ORF Transcript_18404/g.36657 Transcript_18404/m.36657 type:complete len:185 (+) Transcript_18404:579-1133(+)
MRGLQRDMAFEFAAEEVPSAAAVALDVEEPRDWRAGGDGRGPAHEQPTSTMPHEPPETPVHAQTTTMTRSPKKKIDGGDTPGSGKRRRGAPTAPESPGYAAEGAAGSRTSDARGEDWSPQGTQEAPLGRAQEQRTAPGRPATTYGSPKRKMGGPVLGATSGKRARPSVPAAAEAAGGGTEDHGP